MLRPAATKYRPFPVLAMPNRQWPGRVLTQAPRWCSVDLRDGNQALAVPMNVSQKLELFAALVRVGFKEIEVGFPSASATEFEFNRRLIDEGHIPEDVTIQVLVQAREELIEKTVASLIGAKRVIIHLYNSTSPAQRRYVFGLAKEEIVKVATRGTQWIKDRLPLLAGTEVTFQYSPESFSATEIDFSLEICEAVMAVWQPTSSQKIILNLPDTVEVAMPNVYADQIEWFSTHLTRRDHALLSVHTHNDRGTGVAATELALLAGAERVEGTLFGNGERTGNLDLITVALNLYMHGIDPHLDLSAINSLREIYERCTGMTVPARHPYAGELVFTAFSGSHQDAIKKGLSGWQQAGGHWEVPYLTIDPEDIGREYREIIRVNSQSGKGGIAYLLENECGLFLPRQLQKEFGALANVFIDTLGREVQASELKAYFWQEYIDRESPYALVSFETYPTGGTHKEGCRATLTREGVPMTMEGKGNGPIAAFVQALLSSGLPPFEVTFYAEHSLSSGADSNAIAYLEIKGADGKTKFGAGIDTSIELASIKALISALNRLSAAQS
jgi:2-isopropylmalate synthase